MINYTGTFTDTHGITHTDPVFVMESVNAQHTSQANKRFDEETGQYVENNSGYVHISYTVRYYTSQSAYTSGKKALQFVSESGEMNFSIPNGTYETMPVDIVDAAETHFNQNYLV